MQGVLNKDRKLTNDRAETGNSDLWCFTVQVVQESALLGPYANSK